MIIMKKTYSAPLIEELRPNHAELLCTSAPDDGFIEGVDYENW